jgi:hypothetical protein
MFDLKNEKEDKEKVKEFNVLKKARMARVFFTISPLCRPLVLFCKFFPGFPFFLTCLSMSKWATISPHRQ